MNADRAYRAHERLVAPGRTAPALWRLLAGLALIAVITFGLNSTLRALLLQVAPVAWRADFATGNRPGPLLILLASFAFVIIGVMMAARHLQHRPPLGLIGPLGSALAQFWRVLRLLLLFGAVVLVLPPYDMGAPLEPNLPPGRWLMLLPLSLAALLIQTSAEELLFRGYLQQALAARFASPLIWISVPAALFALGHYTPTAAGGNAVLVALWAGLFGALMADLTARAGTLGPAVAVHFFNNITALLIVALPDSMNGLSLFILPFEMSDTGAMRDWLLVDFAMMVLSWLVARIAIRR